MGLSPEERNRLEDVFNTYYDKVYGFLYSRTGNKTSAEDLTSQTFLKIAEKIRSYDKDKGALSTWIFTIALNEMRSFYRVGKSRENEDLDEAAEIQSEDNVEKDFEAREDGNILLGLLGKLDGRQRNVITLKYYGDFSNREIAAILDLSETNISTILSRSLKKLKILLEKCDKFSVCSYKVQEEKNE